MISTLAQIVALSPILAISRWLRTDLILAATLLFLVFASWAMLQTGQIGPARDQVAAADPGLSPAGQHAGGSRPGRIFGVFGVLLGLLGSLTLLAICAW